ncbi:cysteine proteinase [Suillus subaureus]|uniref:Ubiquitin carboxyl-terminal hydrolase n=1 Tax=Suillus subaureus TaxID=48587 RepID=A0A9P7JIH1_9AGAM|nr:cysteine proteinase [Suillus subaureus]KAG1824606.1 cysteine proteinase [Suillus subaureus]
MSESRWIPLESNPDVFNSWAATAGLSSKAHFEDIYGLDPELLGMVPEGVKAVTLLFPCSGTIATKRKEEDERIAAQGQHSIDPTIFWMKQTIVNACGTMGLLHALINSNVTFAPESPLARFIDECKDKTPLERAKILEETSLFERIHTSAATSGQTTVPGDLDTYFHFTCFVRAPDVTARGTETQARGWRVIELDGARNGPIDRGECTSLLQDVAKIVKEHYIKESKSVNFSMMALCSGQD